ncbi:hypothetical protein ZIOFF_023031 [Zingiber officinale]|uniref:Uncharacterized protein n=1 Tax=Zingiber officinale TaxID=94328 RepID=A0A8J5HDL5_ZINOF|nr:hypothetical protein ZIOFF_023031 [Zingiber officinale]
MLSESGKEPCAVGKRKGRDPDEAQSAAEPKRARAAVEAAARGKDNRLLAGFLAHEFLSTGTLLGQRWDPSSGAVKQGRPAAAAYTQVSYLLLKVKGPHIAGVLNPTQLAGWLQISINSCKIGFLLRRLCVRFFSADSPSS